jgi:Tfp pilus assembly protein PilF
MQPETVVRLDQNTVVKFNQSTDEIEVEFFAVELAAELRDSQSVGAGYFITRFPKKFKVKTPHMNAAVEGTEFMVEISADATTLTVLEGEVSSESVATQGRQLVSAGQSIQSGAAGAGEITAVVKPLDAVSWVLHYPRLSDSGATARAEELLQRGSADEALAEVDAAISANPSDADALALRSVIHIARNDKAAALASAEEAIASDANSYRAWLARSYAEQASFALDQALESAKRAQTIHADSSLLHARVAELSLSLGDNRGAAESARLAIASRSSGSYAHSILGFVHLAEIAAASAQTEFETAIELDSFSALARLGLGLAIIRQGNLKGGREQLEIAVALDPANSLLRSYIGKAYYEENTRERVDLAEKQFELAKSHDPRDPTPWLYDAIRLQTTNRPVEAVSALQESIELNGNRAVFRSREMLVEDSAVRAISLARAYQEIGFDKQAVRESAVSINADPGNSSAHRFLADSYLSLPRHEIARRSELLQAQLFQPLTIVPIQPQLTEDNFIILRGSGPTAAGFNEFTPLFTRNGYSIQADLIAGDLGTLGDQITISGINDQVAFAISQLAYATDGVRENDEFDKSLYSGFIQFEPNAATSMQAELRHSESEFGDPLLAFDPDLVIDDRHDLKDTRGRIGLRRNVGPGSDFILSASVIDQKELVRSFGTLAIEKDLRTYVFEARHTLTRERFNLSTGISYDSETQDEAFFGFPTRFKPYAANLYGYLNAVPFTFPLTIHLGASIDYLADKDDITPSRDEFNPKLGITVTPWAGATLRAATTETMGRQFAISEMIEPTQVAGFNQFYDDPSASESRKIAIAFDQSFSGSLFAGVEWGRRDLTVPFDFTGEQFQWDERYADVHVYWAPNDRIGATVSYQEEEFSRPIGFPGKELITEIETRSLPFGLAIHLRNMFFSKLVATYVEQSGEFFFINAGPDPVPAEDRFWIADLTLGYRLPRRMGTLSIDIRNLFDEQFQYQETDLFTRRFAKERVVLFRASLAF